MCNESSVVGLLSWTNPNTSEHDDMMRDVANVVWEATEDFGSIKLRELISPLLLFQTSSLDIAA